MSPFCSIAAIVLWPSFAAAQDASIRVHTDRPLFDVSRTMTGACIEDVNHEIYGGLYSQMIFGESFQEPAPSAPIVGFKTYGGSWLVIDGELHAGPGDGPKLIHDGSVTAGTVSVEMMFPDDKNGLAGLILKVAQPGVGADRFIGYEVSLTPARQRLLLGRHRHNWEPIREIPCEFPIGKWVALSVQLTETSLAISVDGREVLKYEDRDHPLRTGAVGLRTWQRNAKFRNLRIATGGKTDDLSFRVASLPGDGAVSGMWRSLQRGSAKGRFALDARKPFLGTQCQQLTFESGQGEIGVENRGLNRWGMSFVGGRPYEGYVWLRTDRPTNVFVALENKDGNEVYAESKLAATGSAWKRYDFALTANGDDSNDRFAIKLKQPGSVAVGHAFLQPGPWGRFKGLPVRRDIAEGMIAGGFTVLRYGGSMINADEYRWKKMIGPRDRRPPYKGTWYPYSSNGWGVIDFLDFCQAAAFAAVPDLNIDETPQDLADFIEHVNGPPDSEWGARRVQDGHPPPYRLRFLELGNEEAVDETYWTKFKPRAEAIWKKDPAIILIVGDFEYKKPIVDPVNFEGAPRIKSLAAHKKILDLAKANGREVWFDVHIWNHHPREALGPIAALKTFAEALEKLSPGAPFKICVLEENAINHAVRRGIAHVETINGLMRLGDRVKIVCAANGLQPDGQNDNGWDQGLLFLNPSQVWGQPPYYVTQMLANNFRPRLLKTDVESRGDALDAVALANVNGRRLTLQVVNRSAESVRARLVINAPFGRAKVTQIEGPLDAANTADEPERIASWSRSWSFRPDFGSIYTFPPYSVAVFAFE